MPTPASDSLHTSAPCSKKLHILRAHRIRKTTIYEIADYDALREFGKRYGVAVPQGKPIKCPHCGHTWLTQARNAYITCPKCHKARRAPWVPPSEARLPNARVVDMRG